MLSLTPWCAPDPKEPLAVARDCTPPTHLCMNASIVIMHPDAAHEDTRVKAEALCVRVWTRLPPCLAVMAFEEQFVNEAECGRLRQQVSDYVELRVLNVHLAHHPVVVTHISTQPRGEPDCAHLMCVLLVAMRCYGATDGIRIGRQVCDSVCYPYRSWYQCDAARSVAPTITGAAAV